MKTRLNTMKVLEPSSSHRRRFPLQPTALLLLLVLAAVPTTTSADTNNDTTTSSSPPCENKEKSSSLSAMMGLEGNVSECTCSFTEIEDANIDTVLPLLQKVVDTPFFSHFKIDLCTECELWDDAPLCMLRECSVCECDAPPSWAVDGVESLPRTGPDPNCKHVEDQVLLTHVDSHLSNGWSTTSTTTDSFTTSHDKIVLDGSSSSFMRSSSSIDQDDNDSNQNSNTEVVVDLRVNPERYTGYSGPSADKVWSAIHSTNCFQPTHEKLELNDESLEPKVGDPMYCLLPAEQRLYNRVISGLHSSISLHIAHSYCQELDSDKIGECKKWGFNADIAYDRVLNHPDRVENLYVAFALLLRAVVKAGDAVTAAVPKEDPYFAHSLSNWAGSLLPELTKMAQDCPHTFDESTLLAQPDFREKKRMELQRRFQNLQKIIQCVGCDRCKLWGTLQTLGIGTALKLLFNDVEKDGEIQLSRQEAVALVHTLERLSSSLVYAREMGESRKNMMEEEEAASTAKILL